MKILVRKFFDNYNLKLEDMKAVVGVSTGVDSMVLLTILEELGLELIVCHVNHKKRLASEQEEQFIRDYCNKKNIKLYVKSLEDIDLTKGNFQDEARSIRLDFFKEVCLKENAKYLILGHHLNDDIETFFMRLFRGSSIEAISGIKEIYYENNISIIRPLLKFTKEEILTFAKVNNIVYYEDESNTSDDYTRNRIRHNIIPEIFLEEPSFNKKFIEFKDMMEYSAKIVNDIVDDAIRKIFNVNTSGFIFEKDKFTALDSFIQKEVLFKLLFNYKFSKKNIEEIIKYINSSRSNLFINYKNIVFIKEYNKVSIKFDDFNDSVSSVVIDAIGVYPIDEKYTVSVSKKNNVFLANNSKIWYNSKDLPVIVRKYESGDSISLGFGTKKVARILIDNKIPITQRKNTFVLVKDDEVLAVFNHARSINLTPKEECDIVITLKENENDY
ncbi:MAG: tRNA lysidine(34) synthetase TilS [Bacilli bacterium]